MTRHTHDDKEFPGYCCTTTGLEMNAPDIVWDAKRASAFGAVQIERSVTSGWSKQCCLREIWFPSMFRQNRDFVCAFYSKKITICFL
jgi:hypothetical protein